MKQLAYRNPISVAAHRGNSKYFPENTIVAMQSAKDLNPDMIETDLHMTSDGHIIVMHDHLVDRTTNGTGLIREKTLAEMKALDAGSWKGEEFAGQRVPTFEELLDFFRDCPNMLFNIELKDYPAMSGEFAFKSAEKSIAMMKEAGIWERSVINSWSGELNEYLVDRYGDDIRIHAYTPERMGANQKKLVYNYAYCMCLFGVPEKQVVAKSHFDFCKSYGVEPWVYYKQEDPALFDEAIANGAMLFTANDPAWAIEYLRSKGLHD